MIPYPQSTVRTTEPGTGPVSRTEAKLFLRQDETADDDLIDTILTGAREWCEEYTGRSFLTQTWTQYIDWKFPRVIELPRGPVQSITSIKYYDTDGSLQTLSTDVYTSDLNREPRALVYEDWSQSWPAARYQRQTIQVAYVTGYGDSDDVPESIKVAVRQLIKHWYDQRDPVVVGSTTKTLDAALKALLNKYRIRWSA